MYFAFFGFGTFIIVPHISHWCFIVSGPFGLAAASRVRPTSVDHPTESEYESVFFIFLLLSESFSFLFFRPLPGGALLAMITAMRHYIQSLRLFSSIDNCRFSVNWCMHGVPVFL